MFRAITQPLPTWNVRWTPKAQNKTIVGSFEPIKCMMIERIGSFWNQVPRPQYRIQFPVLTAIVWPREAGFCIQRIQELGLSPRIPLDIARSKLRHRSARTMDWYSHGDPRHKA